MNGLYGLLSGSAVKYPEKAFIQSMDSVWTYKDTYGISKKLSEYLVEYGVGIGDRVVIFCDNSIQYVVAFYATLRVNAIAVPVNPAKMTDSILYIIEKCTPSLILTCNSTAAKLDGISGVQCLNIDLCIQFDYQNNENVLDDVQDFESYESCPAVILFTSGTTAQPKGVTLTQGNLMANTEAIIDYLKLTCKDSILMTLPFSYSYGNSILLTHTFAGATLIIENSTVFPYKVLEAIKKHKVSGFSTVGSYINLILKCIKNSDADLKFFDNLRYITLAGEATGNDDISYINKNFPHLDLFVMYGQTEASARLSFLSPDLIQRKLGSIGKGLNNVELRVVDKAGNLVKPGEIGEIIAHGPSIMKCYWSDPVSTEEVLKEEWLYTGDSATIDEDGYIYIKGRKTDMIKHMGHRISPIEIENVINNYSFVKESAAIESIIDGLSVIKVFVVLEKECSMEDLRKSVYSKLPVYMRPQVFEVMDQLPKTESGKIRRSMLRRYPCAE